MGKLIFYKRKCLNLECLERAVFIGKLRVYRGVCLSSYCLRISFFLLSQCTGLGPLSQLKGVSPIDEKRVVLAPITTETQMSTFFST